jgi:hypothetical protein
VDCLGLFRREDVSGASQGEIDDVRLGLMSMRPLGDTAGTAVAG